MRLCIIPARGGSKRIPRKNIRYFRGLPVIARSILAAQQSNCFDKIIVSTDDSEIAAVAESYGAEIPFKRPAHLSDDYANTTEVVKHAISALDHLVQPHDLVCCIYATAPFLVSADLQSSLDLLYSSRDGTVVFAATSFPFPIQRSIRLDQNGYSSAFDHENVFKRSQDLEEFFHDVGMFYWASAETWNTNVNIFDIGRPLLLPRWRVQDIDTNEDWIRAELMHETLEKIERYKNKS